MIPRTWCARLRKVLLMIRLIDGQGAAPFLAFCEGNPYGVRIAAFLEAYGPGYPFALFWMQADGSGRMTAAVARVDGNVTVCAAEKADLEELWVFLSAVGFESILCPEWVAQRANQFSGCLFQRCIPMRLHRPCVPSAAQPAALCKAPPLPEVYALLQAAGEPLPCLEAWLPDVSHRVRHAAARVWAVREGAKWIACAMAVALTRKEALLGGVAVLPEQRAKGIGSSLTLSLCGALLEEGKTVFLLRKEGLHESFYRRMGFEPFGPSALIITQKGV